MDGWRRFRRKDKEEGEIKRLKIKKIKIIRKIEKKIKEIKRKWKGTTEFRSFTLLHSQEGLLCQTFS